MEYLVLGLAWLVLSFPLAVVVGKCVSFGQSGATARRPAVAAQPETAAAPRRSDPVSADSQSAPAAPGSAALPTQRRPEIPARTVSR